VDSHCPLAASNYSVVEDYDVTLNQVDIKSNKNKFYRIQLLSSGTIYHVWTRWGRVGEVGQSSLLGPFNKTSGGNEFVSKFRDKTGNKWDERDKFVCKTGKYDLIHLKDDDNQSETSTSILGTPVRALPVTKAYPPSIHPLETQKLISFILDVRMFQETMQSMNIDVKRMPLGTLSVTQINSGYEILEAMKEVIIPKKKNKKTGKKISSSSSVTVSDDLVTLSGRFYQTIPHSYSRNQRPPVITAESELEAKFDMLATLKDIITAQNMLASSHVASDQRMTVNPIDMKYNELNSDLTLLPPSHPLYPIIVKYISNTKAGYASMVLENIWAVNRHSENKSFSSFQSLDNHRLLWHGTNTAVVAAILRSGLRIMPSVNGGRVGRGIYMANELSKSAAYVRTGVDTDGKRIGILFLVEAALGQMNVIHSDDPSLTAAPPGYDSVLAEGSQHPDPAGDVLVDIDGTRVLVPQGIPCNVAGASGSRFFQDEFLVYREAQQRLRFILTFKY